MYKARKSKYFKKRYEGVIRSVTAKHVYASVVDLDDDSESEVMIDRVEFSKLPKVSPKVFFNMYFVEKNNKRFVLIEPKKFPVIPPEVIEREAKAILKLLKPQKVLDNSRVA